MNNYRENCIIKWHLSGNNPAIFAVSTDMVESLAQAVFANFNNNQFIARAT